MSETINAAQTFKPKVEGVLVRQAMSVWAVWGCPVTANDTKGAHRRGLYLLPLAASIPQVALKFLESASQDDNIKYDRAKIEEFKYIGFVWVEL